jgi:phenylalanyl-tRNA synthetase beta chain
MKVSVNWLRDLVEFDETPQQIAERITFGAFELEGMDEVHRPLTDLVAGQIVESKQHPDADKLKLTKVDVGGDILDIVCGAPNCTEGVVAPVAKPGTRLGDLEVGVKKLRGIESHGMILSEKEMGLTDDHTGVMELDPAEYKPGQSLANLAPHDDTILDFEITVNRPDALSHVGIAREIAAYLRQPLKMPSFDVVEEGVNAVDKLIIEILDPKQGPRYTGRIIEGVTVQKSPLWMRLMLHSLGQRPINNIVDITNYVLFELGHPLHAFDYHLVKDGHIIVRLAKEGEHLTTLDDKERMLSGEDLLIADPEKGIALAGVMGGANSEVDESTRDILVEAAYFDPPTVRKTAKKLGLGTEASKRFERGADPSMPPKAAARCAELIRRLGGGTILKGEVDTYPNPIRPRRVTMRPSRASLLLGLEIKPETAEESLEALQLPVKPSGNDELTVSVPTFRPDIEREVDLIEEIARIVGYDTVPTSTASRVVLSSRQDPREQLYDTAMDLMVGMGFHEVVNSGMASGQDHELFAGGLAPYPIERPISPEMNVYRASLIPSLLRSVEHNLNVGYENLRFVEMGQLGGRGWFGEEGEQHQHISFVLTGTIDAPSYVGSTEQIDLPFMKGVISTLSRGLSLDNPEEFSYDIADNLVEGLRLYDADGKVVLQVGRIRDEIAEKFGVDRPVYACEINLERWARPEGDKIRRPGAPHGFKPFSRQPANVRDLAVIAAADVQARQITDTIRKAGGDHLERVTLFDLYEGKPLKDGERSLAFHLVFRAMEKTLSDDEVEPAFGAVVKAVTSMDGVRQR